MATQKTKARTWDGMGYRQVQRANSDSRAKLPKKQQIWLKSNGYRNTGWDNIISLYKKIEEFLKDSSDDLTLEELFLQADRIGNKYLTNQEVEDFNQKLSKEVSEVSEIIDAQFPDTEVEVIDFTDKSANKARRKGSQKSYKTIKL